jgi:hypothetical protein
MDNRLSKRYPADLDVTVIDSVAQCRVASGRIVDISESGRVRQSFVSRPSWRKDGTKPERIAPTTDRAVDHQPEGLDPIALIQEIVHQFGPFRCRGG